MTKLQARDSRDAKNTVLKDKLTKNRGVLILYTGGTIGSMPKDKNDPESPQVVVDWATFKERSPELENLPYRVDGWPMEPPLDSCNVELAHWQMMADVIKNKYDEYEGFVILHGTDSMVYTGAALSFMLVNLDKPVVITGAQRTHLFQSRNDGLQNMLTAIELANPSASDLPVIPEVVIFFQQEILRGSRARKLDAAGLRAYTSPNFSPLGRVEVDIHLDKSRIRNVPDPSKAFYVRRFMDTNVVTFDVYPGIQRSSFVQNILEDNSLKGIIIRAFGAGNIPTDPEFLKMFETAAQRGVVIQVVTQCMQGGVSLGLYETSADLLNIGMYSGTDLTPEAALVKLMIALAVEDFKDDPAAIRRYLETNQVGEQTTSIFSTPLRLSAQPKILDKIDERCRMPANEPISSDWDHSTLTSVQLRLWQAEILTAGSADNSDCSGGNEDSKPLDFEIYVNLSSEEDPNPDAPNFAGSFKRVSSQKAGILQFDVTDACIRVMDPGSRPSFTIIVKSSEGSLSWQGAEIALFVDEAV